MICELCEEGKARYVIRNIHNDNKLSVCIECQKGFDFKFKDGIEEVKFDEHRC